MIGASPSRSDEAQLGGSVTDGTAVVERFYQALQRGDAAGIRAVYAPGVVYSDPVFGELRGRRALTMWEMFCAREERLGVAYSGVRADGEGVRAHWVASYSFGARSRPVENSIESRFMVVDGLITQHHDDFDVRRWAGQALGTMGRALGGTPPLRRALRRRTVAMLDAFEQGGG